LQHADSISRDGDFELLEILRKVRLETLASRMGGGDERAGLAEHNDWSKVLSLGEQQRLAFARVLYNRKSISVIVLDEATSALDDVAEAAMYTLLEEMNATYLSVGHRSSLNKYHTKKLTLNGPGCEVTCVPIVDQSGEREEA
jgi:putative ATP-binding cassette transporter